ncbi:MAG: aldehyde ferredoxin oxidoreductase family protein [Chloroflexi bacterium]|nr:aldehyde ferredoxin oxidoreductase family protein [Chloroflexota bacterium]
MPGWIGKILRVDLGSGAVKTEPLPSEYRTRFVGGRGAAVKLLWDEIDPAIGAFSAQNKLIFSTGPLTGTGAITGCLFTVATKSPLSGGIACSSSRGYWGTELKHAGYDMLVLEGKAAGPVCLDIQDDKVALLPAGHLWGLNTSETERLIKARMHDKWKARDTFIACIGPAGEKLSRIASIVNDKHWAASGGGVGAVMGSKNLKAISIRGSGDIFLSSSKPFMDLIFAYLEQVKSMPLTSEHLPKQGTSFLLDKLTALGAMSTLNFSDCADPAANGLGGKLRSFLAAQVGCFSCPIACEHIASGPDGVASIAPGFEAMASLGPGCGIHDAGSVLEASRLCLDLGLDPVSAGNAIACALELSQAGALTARELGVAARFGDGAAVLRLIDLMGRREGFGDVLAEGGHAVAQRSSSPEAFMGVRKQGIPAIDPRAIQGAGLHYATANCGPSFEGGDVLLGEVLGLTREADPASTTGKPALVKEAQDMAALMESAGLCSKMLMGGFSVLEVFGMMEMVTASGMNDSDLLKAGERIFNLERLFNLKAGLTGESDALPPRMLATPLPGGPARGQVSRLPELLPEYRVLRGWDEEGRPTSGKLAELGLDDGLEERARK